MEMGENCGTFWRCLGADVQGGFFLGKCSYVYLFDIMYMTESWLERPVSAIKARLELNDFYVNSLYRYDFKWSQNGE